jgi:hypothetical protein
VRSTVISCKECRCFCKALGDNTRPENDDGRAGVCIRRPPAEVGHKQWARYPIVNQDWGCFDGIPKSKEQFVADTLREDY